MWLSDSTNTCEDKVLPDFVTQELVDGLSKLELLDLSLPELLPYLRVAEYLNLHVKRLTWLVNRKLTVQQLWYLRIKEIGHPSSEERFELEKIWWFLGYDPESIFPEPVYLPFQEETILEILTARDHLPFFAPHRWRENKNLQARLAHMHQNQDDSYIFLHYVYPSVVKLAWYEIDQNPLETYKQLTKEFHNLCASWCPRKIGLLQGVYRQLVECWCSAYLKGEFNSSLYMLRFPAPPEIIVYRDTLDPVVPNSSGSYPPQYYALLEEFERDNQVENWFTLPYRLLLRWSTDSYLQELCTLYQIQYTSFDRQRAIERLAYYL